MIADHLAIRILRFAWRLSASVNDTAGAPIAMSGGAGAALGCLEEVQDDRDRFAGPWDDRAATRLASQNAANERPGRPAPDGWPPGPAWPASRAAALRQDAMWRRALGCTARSRAPEVTCIKCVAIGSAGRVRACEAAASLTRRRRRPRRIRGDLPTDRIAQLGGGRPCSSSQASSCGGVGLLPLLIAGGLLIAAAVALYSATTRHARGKPAAGYFP